MSLPGPVQAAGFPRGGVAGGVVRGCGSSGAVVFAGKLLQMSRRWGALVASRTGLRRRLPGPVALDLAARRGVASFSRVSLAEGTFRLGVVGRFSGRDAAAASARVLGRRLRAAAGACSRLFGCGGGRRRCFRGFCFASGVARLRVRGACRGVVRRLAAPAVGACGLEPVPASAGGVCERHVGRGLQPQRGGPLRRCFGVFWLPS